MNIAYNMDCLEAMKQMPDNAFDLAVVDPPYGDALHADDGGGGGWFKKYRQNDSQIVQVERAMEPLRRTLRPVQECTDSAMREHGVSRTGGTWAARFSKKSFRGT